MSSESTTNAVNPMASSKEKQSHMPGKSFTNLIGVISGRPLNYTTVTVCKMKNLLAWRFMALHAHVGISQGRNN